MSEKPTTKTSTTKTASERAASGYHVPIMADEILSFLGVTAGKTYFDGTLGGGGHSQLILEAGGRLIATDRDIEAIDECTKRFAAFDGQYKLVRDNFKNAITVLDGQAVSGALLDLGVSSHQIDTAERGMSFRFDAPLDMRMDRTQHLSAAEVVNEYSESELVRILFEYGEERFARRIAAKIVKERAIEPITTTGRLAEIIASCIPKPHKSPPCMRSFQAIRIEVNNELRGLEKAIIDIFSMLESGARLCILAFHSLEDRIVKQTFKRLSEDCICDKSLPICVCGHVAEGKLLGKAKASKQEIASNSRSASATLRIIEKI